MEQQIIRIDDLLASHVWEPQPTNQVGQDDGNQLGSCPLNRIHNTACISLGESMQEEQSIGIYYILNSLTAKSCYGGTKNSRSDGF